jgi:Uma2 family endonuclease
MTAALKVPGDMNVEEFLDWVPGDNQMWQLVDGVPLAMAPANRTHGAIQSAIGAAIHGHLEQQGSGCSIGTAPGIRPRVRADANYRVPDLAVTCSPYTEEEQTLTDPVLVIEILSPSNQAETWTNVWAYTTIPSVREILVIQGARIGANLLRRGTDGAWPEQPLTIDSGDLILESIGLTVPLTALYRTTRLAGG